MKKALRPLALIGCAAAACVSNTAPGNDREARLDPPERPAELAPAEAAIAGVDISLLHPQIITEADRSTIPALQAGCVFRFTRVGYPVFLYPAGAAAPGILKLNGRLVTLANEGGRRFESGGVEVRMRAVDGDARLDEPHDAELILMLPGARNELGYRGFATCGSDAAA